MALSSILSLSDNPIAKAEYRHQRFLITNSRSGLGWILLAVGMLAPAFIASVYYFGTRFTNAEVSPFFDVRFGSIWDQLLGVGTLFMLTMNVALYVVVILITVALAANSISREKRSKTWDTLLLTNIDSRKIVMGKWWASLRSIWGDHTMLMILRLGLVGYALNIANPTAPDGFTAITAYVLPLTVASILFTIVDAMFSCALGVALPLSPLSNAVTGSIGLSVKLATMIVSGGVFLYTMLLIRNQNGFDYLLLIALALLAYSLVTWIMLYVAQYIAIRGQVSSPAKSG